MGKAEAYALIVFDWDGTLMDSEYRIVTCIQRAAAEVGIAVPDQAAARDIIGLGLDEALRRLFPQADGDALENLVVAYRNHWLGDGIPASPLFDGAKALVDGLGRRERLLAVATGKSRRGLDRVLHETGMVESFHATRCADEAFSKPHPQMLHDILTDLDTKPAEALMVGDTEYDMLMAAQAGVAAVGIGHGVHAGERLLAAGAMHCFDDLFALAAWLDAELPATMRD